MTSKEAFNKLIKDYKFETVLDIGSGTGTHTKNFRKHGKKVTPIDHLGDLEGQIKCLYEVAEVEPHDCVWASHVLEHQLNVNRFLKKVHADLKEGGVLCITVPPLKHEIVGGHVTVWNAGLLVYNLVMAGFDCSVVRILQYGNNITILILKKTIEIPTNLHFDKGDIEKLAEFFPPFAKKQGFNGNVKRYNWGIKPNG